MSSTSHLRDSEHASDRTSYKGGGIKPAFASPVKYFKPKPFRIYCAAIKVY